MKRRDGWEIKSWLGRRGLSVADVARKAGISRPTVSEAIHGKRNTRRALQALLDMGCPVKLLALPEDMKGEEA